MSNNPATNQPAELTPLQQKHKDDPTGTPTDADESYNYAYILRRYNERTTERNAQDIDPEKVERMTRILTQFAKTLPDFT